MGSTRASGLQNYAEAFHAAWANQANAGGVSGRGRIRPRSTGSRAPVRSALWALTSPATVEVARKGRRIPTPWCESVPSTSSMPCPPRSCGRSSRRCCPMPLAACGSGPPRRSPAFQEPAAGRPRALRPRGGRIRGRPAPQRRSSGSARDARSLSRAARRHYRGRGRIPSGAAARPATWPGGDQPRRPLPAAGAETDGEQVLRAALSAAPDDAALHHALGLTLVRLNRRDDALSTIARGRHTRTG